LSKFLVVLLLDVPVRVLFRFAEDIFFGVGLRCFVLNPLWFGLLRREMGVAPFPSAVAFDF